MEALLGRTHSEKKDLRQFLFSNKITVTADASWEPFLPTSTHILANLVVSWVIRCECTSQNASAVKLVKAQTITAAIHAKVKCRWLACCLHKFILLYVNLLLLHLVTTPIYHTWDRDGSLQLRPRYYADLTPGGCRYRTALTVGKCADHYTTRRWVLPQFGHI